MKTPKIYLDNCTYNRPMDNQSQIRIRLETEAKLYIQSGVREKKYSLVWSYMLDYENNDNQEKRNLAVERNRESLLPFIRRHFDSGMQDNGTRN